MTKEEFLEKLTELCKAEGYYLSTFEGKLCIDPLTESYELGDHIRSWTFSKYVILKNGNIGVVDILERKDISPQTV